VGAIEGALGMGKVSGCTPRRRWLRSDAARHVQQIHVISGIAGEDIVREFVYSDVRCSAMQHVGVQCA
jgi:hypothetical protein